VAGLLAGCATPPAAVAPSDLGSARTGELLSAQADRSRARRAIRATARVKIDGQRGASFTRELIVLERPKRMRVEVMGLLGQRVAVLTTVGEQYELYQAESPGVERGDIRASILWEVAGVPLTPGDAVNFLLGAPLVPPEAPAGASGSIQQGRATVEWQDPATGVRHRIEFDEADLLVAYHVRAPSGPELLSVRYDDFRLVGDEPFAHAVTLDFPETALHAEIAYKQVELNPDLPGGLFRLEIGGGVSSGSGGDAE